MGRLYNCLHHAIVMERRMPDRRHLLAWIEPTYGSKVVGAFVSAAAAGRAPAKRVCQSPDEARQWVESEAETIHAPVEWVDPRSTVAMRRR